ncbi:histidinol-phosphatase HisJ [Alteribacter aurantiacus]|uniref:histidinol-phosphatase HisJ n=1 Tax=Alteribacter aurantiacus TaxID=254410 RepID=UPI00041A4596|nr:histidinol-phosphatase HisJ [Alteribacter aurantiacus]
MIQHDGHVHSAYCPHGTSDSFEDYVQRAIKLGYKGMTFTEHAPLPPSFQDPVPNQDSAMHPDHLRSYLEELQVVKTKYKNEIDIRIGLEVDYIDGLERETRSFLNDVGPFLDDAILSVHFLKINDHYTCLDYSPDMFLQAVHDCGSLEALYNLYFKTVLQSSKADLGPFKPKRIGHITLVRKFQKRYPVSFPYVPKVLPILKEIKKQNQSLDINGAGFIKPLCDESYPSFDVLKEVEELNIPCVYGSDAHATKQLGTGIIAIRDRVTLTSPKALS